MKDWDQPNVQIPARMLRDPGHFLSLGGGAGLIPWAPGTWGSLVGVALFLALSGLGPGMYWTTVVVLALIGIPLCGRTGRAIGTTDPGAIVWDEIVGVLVTLGISGAGLSNIVGGFCFFRLLDIVKPWPIGMLDTRLKGGLGVMADDLAAGALAGLAILSLRYLS